MWSGLNSKKDPFFSPDRVRLFLVVFLSTLIMAGIAVVLVPKIRNSLSQSGKFEQEDGLKGSALMEQVFKDVLPDDENSAAIAFLKQKGLIKGFEDGTFRPGEPVKREEFVKLVVSAKKADPHPISNSHCFKDVGNEWFAKYVCYAKNQGWVKGDGEGVFGTGLNITGAEALAIITRSFGVALMDYSDLADIQLTRGQAAGILARVVSSTGRAE